MYLPTSQVLNKYISVQSSNTSTVMFLTPHYLPKYLDLKTHKHAYIHIYIYILLLPFLIFFNWHIFFWQPLQVRPGPQRLPKEEPLEIASARLFTGRTLFVWANQQSKGLKDVQYYYRYCFQFLFCQSTFLELLWVSRNHGNYWITIFTGWMASLSPKQHHHSIEMYFKTYMKFSKFYG